MVLHINVTDQSCKFPSRKYAEDIAKLCKHCKFPAKNTLKEDNQGIIEHLIRLGKVKDGIKQSLFILIKDESKKEEIFQNLNKIRESEVPSNSIT